jgi:hypothetical protein
MPPDQQLCGPHTPRAHGGRAHGGSAVYVRPMEPDEPEWSRVLSAHRSPRQIPGIAERFNELGVTPSLVAQALADPAGYIEAASGGGDWTGEYGGPIAAALIAAELLEQSAARQLAVAGIRSRLVAALVDETSVVETANRLGISHQHASRLRKAGSLGPAIRALVRKGL